MSRAEELQIHMELQLEQEIASRLLSVSGGDESVLDSDSDDERGAADWAIQAQARAEKHKQAICIRQGVDVTLAQLGKGNKLIAEATGLLAVDPDRATFSRPEASVCIQLELPFNHPNLKSVYTQIASSDSCWSEDESEPTEEAEAFARSAQSCSSLSSLDSLDTSHEKGTADILSGSQHLQQHRAQDKGIDNVQPSGPETPPRLDTLASPGSGADLHAQAAGPDANGWVVPRGYGLRHHAVPSTEIAISYAQTSTDALNMPTEVLNNLQQGAFGELGLAACLQLAKPQAAGLLAHHVQTASKDQNHMPSLCMQSKDDEDRLLVASAGAAAAAVKESLQLKILLDRQACEWAKREAAQEAREIELLELTFHYAYKCIAAGEIARQSIMQHCALDSMNPVFFMHVAFSNLIYYFFIFFPVKFLWSHSLHSW